MKLIALLLMTITLPLGVDAASTQESTAERQVKIVASRDYHFTLPNQSAQILKLKANEPLLLRIYAQAGEMHSKDGSVHSLVIRSQRTQGWDIRLKEGEQVAHVRAPAEPGEYLIECTVICGAGHPNMNLKVVVEP